MIMQMKQTAGTSERPVRHKRTDGSKMLFDAHSHIDHDEFTEEERQERIAEIEASSMLEYVADIGYDLASSKMAADHAGRYSWCVAAVGFHPHDSQDMGETELSMIKFLAAKPGVRAIGEIGLDYYYDLSPRDVQREAFRQQIRLALELQKPIVIHSRQADQEVMDILKEEQAFSDSRKACFPARKTAAGWESAAADARVMIHCFSGSAEMAEQYVKLGATISIAGPVTYKNNKKTIRVVEAIPAEFLLTETDSPFLAPEPFRGRANRSVYVEHTARRMALIKQMDFDEFSETANVNAQKFYGII